jgi:uncharacterized protein YcgI (DUF1989 family)
LFSSCSAYDYRERRFGLTEPHASYLTILANVLAPYGVTEPMIPDPFNIFQHSHIEPEFQLLTRAPLSCTGDYVEFLAESDCLVALTACPQEPESLQRLQHHRHPGGVALNKRCFAKI